MCMHLYKHRASRTLTNGACFYHDRGSASFMLMAFLDCFLQASSPTVKAIFILDSDGNRVCAKYYDKSYPTAKDQLALEKKLYLKTKNSNPRLEGASFKGSARSGQQQHG